MTDPHAGTILTLKKAFCAMCSFTHTIAADYDTEATTRFRAIGWSLVRDLGWLCPTCAATRRSERQRLIVGRNPLTTRRLEATDGQH